MCLVVFMENLELANAIKKNVAKYCMEKEL